MIDEATHRLGDNVFRLRNRLKAACEDHEARRMNDDEFAAYVRRTVLGMTDRCAALGILRVRRLDGDE